jgi:hypothetical protein
MALPPVVPDGSWMYAWNPQGVGQDPPSKTQRSSVLKILGTEKTITIPVYTNTKVNEVKGMLSFKLGVPPEKMKFTMKQGTIYRTNLDTEEIARSVTVSGIKDFCREKKEWPHPHVVIGAGHIGLKMAMTWLMEEPEPYTNFVVFDRYEKVGGTSWHKQANKTTRLQTEVGVYHLQYHEKNGWPVGASDNPWPSRDQILDHFQEEADKFGIMPYCRLNTNCTKLNIIGKDYWDSYYELSLDNKGKESTITCASVSFFPGNLTNPKRVIYKGEEQFDGDIVYGISCEYDYSSATGNDVCIVGSGAFAVENVRTLVEFSARKIYMVCRRKTMSMPRLTSWYINQSAQFISAVLTLECAAPMYDLIGVDQWSYYCVYANEARTTCTMRQKSRFGIGDVYFLGMYYELVDHVVDDIKRVSSHKIHLISGRNLENIQSMLKLLGFNGEFENDRLIKLKELYGWWANKDFKRYIVAEPLGVDANNFGGTSFSPGAIMWAEEQIYFLHYPKDFIPCMEGMGMPTHVADESIDRPAYVVEARHGALIGITLGAMVPGIAERGNVTGPLKRERMWQINPLEKFMECCRKEWDHWSKIIQDSGYTKPHPPYPYTQEFMYGMLEKEQQSYRAQEEQMRKRMGM